MLQLAHLKVAQPGAFWPWICHWFQYPIWHECQTTQPKPGKYHHHKVALTAQNFLTLSCYPSLTGPPNYIQNQHRAEVSFCWSTTLVCPCVGVHKRTLLVSLSLPIQQYSACLVWRLYEMGGKWLYNNCFVRCCFLDLFKTACSIIV